jgi:hypothetical protein
MRGKEICHCTEIVVLIYFFRLSLHLIEHNGNGNHGNKVWLTPRVWLELIWHGTSHNHPKTTAKLSCSCWVTAATGTHCLVLRRLLEGLLIDFHSNVICLHIYVCTDCISGGIQFESSSVLYFHSTLIFHSSDHSACLILLTFDPFPWVWFLHHNKLLCNIYF